MITIENTENIKIPLVSSSLNYNLKSLMQSHIVSDDYTDNLRKLNDALKHFLEVSKDVKMWQWLGISKATYYRRKHNKKV